jgi:CubicO group peptidase (beta-lactamase class C family)
MSRVRVYSRSMKTLMASFVVVALVVAGFLAAGRISRPATESVGRRVDKEFAEWDRKDGPGCSVAAARNGVILYERGYGMANLELGVPITPASRFMVASISKPMTAMSILLLAEAGKLSIDDEVRKYVPEFPDYGKRITIRHLLSHTSGIRNAYLLRELADPFDETTNRIDALVRLLSRQKDVNFEPGAEFQYNNGGYTMLADIVRRVSGRPLGAYAEANIFKPLGMTHTRFHDDPAMMEPNRATGYHRDGSSWTIPVHSDIGRIVGNSGLFTTPRDLLLWQQNFAAPHVGSPATLSAMQTAVTLTGGATSPYALGVFVGQYRGLRTISHSGGDPGYAANLVRFPDRGLGIAILCNFDDPPLGRMTNDLADIFVEDAPEKPAAPEVAPDVKIVQLTAEELASRTGVYRDPQTDTFSRLYVRDGKLMTEAAGDTFELRPTSANRFVLSGTSIALEFTGDREAHVVGFGPKPTIVQKVDPLKLSAAEMNMYAGRYTNTEVEAMFTMAAADSKLVLRRHARPDIRLDPVYPDTFQANLVGLVRFSRDAAGKVTGFSIKTDGVRNIRFDRMR